MTHSQKPTWPLAFYIISTVVFLIFPINILGYYKRQILSFFSGGNFLLMFDVSYFWAVLILVERVLMPLLAMLALVCILFLFLKHKWFPWLVKGLFATYLVLLLLDLLANNFLADYANIAYKNAINSDIYRNIGRTMLYMAFVFPFLYLSPNIKATFTSKAES